MFTKLVEMLENYNKDSIQLQEITDWININFQIKSNNITEEKDNQINSILQKIQRTSSINVDQEKLSQPLQGKENTFKETLLHLAVRHDNIELLNWLLIQFDDIDVNSQDVEGFTPWLRAVQLKNQKIAEILKNHNKNNPDVTNKLGENAAHFMIGFLQQWQDFNNWLPKHDQKKNSAEKIFVELVKNSRTKQGKNILHYAFLSKQIKSEIIQELCKIDYKLMFEADSNAITPIFYAIEHLQDQDLPTIIDILVESKPWYKKIKGLIEYKNKEGYTPWLWAIKSGKLTAAKCLKHHDAISLCENNIGENGFHLIVEHLTTWDVINEYIPQKECNILADKKNIYGENVLHYACKFATQTVVKELNEQYPLLINEFALDTGEPPIFYAFKNKRAVDNIIKEIPGMESEGIISILLDSKSVIASSKNKNILQMACETENISPGIIEIICSKFPILVVQLGAKKRTPLFCAIESKQDNKVIEVLLKERDINQDELKPRILKKEISKPVITTVRIKIEQENSSISIKDDDDLDNDLQEDQINGLKLNASIGAKKEFSARDEETINDYIKIIKETAVTEEDPIYFDKNYQDIKATKVTSIIVTATPKICKNPIKHQDVNGDTLWLYAIRCGNLDAANFLQSKGAVLTCASAFGENAVHLILPHLKNWGDIEKYIPKEIVKELIEQPTKNNETFLHYACEKAVPDVVRSICQLYPQFIEAKTTDNQWTPIFYAIKSKNASLIINILINNKAIIECQDANGFTPWLLCMKEQHLDAATTLRINRAKLDCRNNNNENALYFIISKEISSDQIKLSEPEQKDTWLPLKERNQLLQDEYKNYFVDFMRKLFETAVFNTIKTLPDNCALIAFQFSSYPNKVALPQFAYAIIVDEMSKNVKSDLEKVREEFNTLIAENARPTKIKSFKPTCFQLINTPHELVKDLFQREFLKMSVVAEVYTIIGNEKLEHQSSNKDRIIENNNHTRNKNLVTEFSEEVKTALSCLLGYDESIEQNVLSKLNDLALNINLLLQVHSAEDGESIVNQQYWESLDDKHKNSATDISALKDDPKLLGTSWLVESFYSTIAGHGVGKTKDFIFKHEESGLEKKEKEQLKNISLRKIMRSVPLVKGELLTNLVPKDSPEELNKPKLSITQKLNKLNLDLNFDLFCETVFFSFIINQENTPEHFIFHTQQDNHVELVNINNNASFTSDWNNHSALYDLPQMRQVIHKENINKMLEFDSAYSLTLWLLKIEVQRRQMQTLDKAFIIPISEEMIALVYENWLCLREILLTKKGLTLANVLTLLQRRNESKNNMLYDMSRTTKLSGKIEKENPIGESNTSDDSINDKQEKKENIKSNNKQKVNEKTLTLDDFELIPEEVDTGFFGPSYKPEQAFKKLQQLEQAWWDLADIRKDVESGKLKQFKTLCNKHKEIVLFGSAVHGELKKAMNWTKTIKAGVLLDYLIKEKIAFQKIIITDCSRINSEKIIQLCLLSPGLIKLELNKNNEFYEKIEGMSENKLLIDELSPDNIEAILSSCLFIEELTISNMPQQSYDTLVIASKSIKILTITACNIKHLQLVTPQLTVLKLHNDSALEEVSLLETPCLSELEIINCLNFIALANDSIDNIRRVAKFDIHFKQAIIENETNGFKRNVDSKLNSEIELKEFTIPKQQQPVLTDHYQKYPFLMLYTTDKSQDESLAILFNEYNTANDEGFFIFQQALKKLESFNQIKNFFESLNKIEDIKSDNGYEQLWLNDKKLTYQHIAKLCNFNENITDENILETIKNYLASCQDKENAMRAINFALLYVKMDYKTLSLELFNSLSESLKRQHAELGLLGIGHEKNIKIHEQRFKTDHTACLALIALGKNPKNYEKQLLWIVLSNPSPVMAWRAIEQLAEIYPSIKKELPSTLDYENQSLIKLLTVIYATNGDLLIQSMFVLEELANAHKNKELSPLSVAALTERLGCILENKNVFFKIFHIYYFLIRSYINTYNLLSQ